MANEFDDQLAQMKAASAEQDAAPSQGPEAAAPAVADSNPFDQALAEAKQQATQEVALEMPEPDGGHEH
jgi:hypothetical protein